MYVWQLADHLAIRVVPALGFAAFFRQFCVNALWTCCVRSVLLVFGCYVIWGGGAMMSCVMSRHCMCTSHVTFCYKRSVDTSFGTLLAFWPFWLLVRPSGLPLSPMYSWCLTHVGRDASSASPGWSLLPSSVFIVLALVNRVCPTRGLRYLNETRECCPAPCQYCFHRTAVPFSWCLCALW